NSSLCWLSIFGDKKVIQDILLNFKYKTLFNLYHTYNNKKKIKSNQLIYKANEKIRLFFDWNKIAKDE
ncbi:hypothetical protein, partial [Providencia rustigianii]